MRDPANSLLYSCQLLETNNDPTKTVGALHNFSLISFNFGYRHAAKAILNKTIEISSANNLTAKLAYSYIYRGLLNAEQGLFELAISDVSEGMSQANKIKDKAYFERTICYTNAYTARIYGLAGKYQQAESLYREAIDKAKKLNISQKLFLGQIFQGLGESLMAMDRCKEAREWLVQGEEFQNEATKNFEHNSEMLRFTITSKSCSEQIKVLDQKTCY